jgi:hypothetical protein
MNAEPLKISARFRGPPDSGNGGYTAGCLAAGLDGPVEVRLRRPPPLDHTLTRAHEGTEVVLYDGDQELARARPAELTLAVPPPPAAERARAVEGQCQAFADHPFPGCFVCGPDRGPGDGLRIFPGPLNGEVAADWQPGAEFADADGRIRPELIWAALDCPGSFALTPAPGKWMVLGSLTATMNERPATDEPLVVSGWDLGRDGRKLFAGTALFNETGRCLAWAKAVWIEVEPY